METELPARRTMRAKVFDRGDGSFHIHSNIQTPLHYYDNGWEDVDLTLKVVLDGWCMDKGLYTVEVSKDDVGLIYTSRQGGSATIRLEAIGDTLVESLPLSIAPVVSGRNVLYKELLPGLDIRLTIRPGGIEWFKIIKDASAPRKFRWAIDADKVRGFTVQEVTVGRDSQSREATGLRSKRLPRRVEIQNQVSAKVLTEGREAYTLTEEWTGRVSEVLDKGTRIRTWTTDPVYPVIIDAALQENIIADADDVYSNTGYVTQFITHYNNRVYAGQHDYGSGVQFHVGLRFQEVPLPFGATISSATLTVDREAQVGAPKVRFYGIEEGDAPAWADTEGNRPETAGPRTTAFSQIDGLDAGSNEIDVTTEIQEIIDDAADPAWSADSDMRMAFIGSDEGDVLTYWGIEDFSAAGTDEAQLDVVYTVPGGANPHGPLGHPLHGPLAGPIN